MRPGELGLPDFLRPLFLLDADETDFFAADRFFVFFLVAIHFLIPFSNVNDFRSPGPLARASRKECAARIRKVTRAHREKLKKNYYPLVQDLR